MIVREAHLARMCERLVAVQGQVVALRAEIEYMSRGDGPVSDWNATNPALTAVLWGSSQTTTRSTAWTSNEGEALILVKGSILPVPLDSVTAVTS